MNRMLVCLILSMLVGISVSAKEESGVVTDVATVDPAITALNFIQAGDLQSAERQIQDVSDSASKLFVQACIARKKGDPKAAIQIVAQGVVRYPNDPVWTAKSELMSAELYLDLGMTNAADVTARQVQSIYEGTAFAGEADALRAKIKKSMNESE